MAKELAIICSASLIQFSGLAVLTRHVTRSRIPILTYHSISERDGDAPSCLDLTRMRVTPQAFRKQVEYVARHYTAVTLEDIVGSRLGEATLPPHPCVITFDDGYRDAYENAAPVLEQLGLVATFFVIGGPTVNGEVPWIHAIDEILDTLPTARCASAFQKAGPRSFSAGPVTKNELCQQALRCFDEIDRPSRIRFLDRVRADLDAEAKRTSRFLGADQIRNLHKRGFEVGCHSMEHECMARLNDDELTSDIRQCKEVLTDILGRPPKAFCYPFGWKDTFDKRVIDTLKQEGFTCAATTMPGLNDRSTDPFALRRLMMYSDTSVPLLVFRLLGLEAQSRKFVRSVRSAFKLSESHAGGQKPGGTEPLQNRDVSGSPSE